MGRLKPASPLLPHRGPIIIVDEKYSWKKHIEYPSSPSNLPSPYPSPPRPPKAPKAKGANPHPRNSPMYQYYYPDPPPARVLEGWYSPNSSNSTPSSWSSSLSGMRAYFRSPIHHMHAERPNTPNHTNHHAPAEEYETSDAESETNRRIRIAREVDKQMRDDEETLLEQQKLQRREAEKARWKMQIAREKEARRAENARREMRLAREEEARRAEKKNKRWEDAPKGLHGLGIRGLDAGAWERVPNVRPRREAKKREYGVRYQQPGEYEEWKREIQHPVKRSDKGREGVMQRPQRWIEVREKTEGKVEAVMVRRRQPKY